MRRQAKKFVKGSLSDGSALILTVVLTSLLAIVGVLFLMMARVNKITASSISKNKELDSAVETVIAKISNELILDVPGVAGAEYYDYPGPEDKWLAGLEPYKDGNDYKWRQISDVYEKLGPNLELVAEIIPDHQDSLDVNEGKPADADGDGVADSKWVELADMTSSKGKPVYAAIRIVDNGGMLNVNTAYKFDPCQSVERIDGSSQLQINLMGLSERDYTHTPQQKIDGLWSLRAGSAPNDVSSYERNVVWRYGSPNGAYTPFDISDELKLRNRYILNYNLMTSRIEGLWTNAYDGGPYVPRNEKDHSITNPNDWFWIAYNSYPISCPDPCAYDYRHISTTYNMDRIIDPGGKKMVNVNDINDINYVNLLYTAVLKGLDPCLVDAYKVAAQIAVNLKDYIDSDSNVTSFGVGGSTYYGFERPCVYISELAHRFVEPNISPLPLNLIDRSYAIELYKPYYPEDNYPEPSQWQLTIEGSVFSPIPVVWSGSKHFYVIYFEDASAPLDINFDTTGDGDGNLPPWGQTRIFGPGNIVFSGGKNISLQRKVSGDWITVDSVTVPFLNPGSGWLVPDLNGVAHSIQRDITLHKCIRRLWASAVEANIPTLGAGNSYLGGDPNIPAHPEDRLFTNVGEIGKVFCKSAYSQGPNSIGPTDTEATARLDFANPIYQQVSKYLTVFDPHNFDVNYVDEMRIKGRININTAPWYVLAQLPWVSQREGGYNDANLAQAIAAYRDKLNLTPIFGPDYRTRPGAAGFENIGQLCDVNSGSNQFRIDYYSRVVGDQAGFPDLTGNDGIADDFEERDLIFARISDLVTVRSDVFTAYILVRIGTDGPQKRVIAIFDRSNVCFADDGGMRVLAVQPVADPR